MKLHRIMTVDDGVFCVDSRSSPFGFTNYENVADDHSVVASAGGVHHGFHSPGGLPPVPPSLPSGRPSSGLTGSPGGASMPWKPLPSTTQPPGCMAVTRGQESVADVGRLTANMQVSIVILTLQPFHL